jgi:O-antigen/teichoic acid export membrane protein
VARLRNSIIANFAGQIWTVLVGVAFIPVYIRILGIEAYGLISFFIGLQAFFIILDMGLSATLNRELARHRYAGSDVDAQRDLVRTLEWLYWPTGLLIALGVYLFSGPIAVHWLKPVSLSAEQTAHAITLMGISAALQWPSGFYAGGFRGLERQVALNLLNAFFATARYGGAVAVITFHSPTLDAFLWWQVVVSLLQTTLLSLYLWRLLPTSQRTPAFRRERLHEVRHFALGIAAIAAVSFLLMYSDRIVLSALLPLTEFGYYAVAAAIAAALSSAMQPFFFALFPRYSGLVAAGNEAELVRLYHQSNQLLVAVVASTASVMALFAKELLWLWTHDPVIAEKSCLTLSILVIGTALNSLMSLPYALQLAHGWTRLTLVQNILSILFVLPAIWWLGNRFGGPGAAIVWVALNLGYITIGIPLMHRRLLKNEIRAWYLIDVLPTAFAAVATALIARLLIPTVPDGLLGVAIIASVGIVTLGVSAFSTPAARTLIGMYPARQSE